MEIKKYFRRLMRRQSHSTGNVALNPHCGLLEVNNWEVSEFVMDDLIPITGVHPFPVNELCLMVTAVACLKPTHIFEWGTYLGKSARIFHEASRRFGVETAIYSVDLPEEVDHVEHPRERRGMFVKGTQGVSLLVGDGLETSLNLYREFKGQKGYTPMFFIDGDHDYSTVKRELEAILETAPEAHILLHDTFFQSPESGYNVGPYQALQDVITSAHNYKILRQELGLPGMTLLYRKNGFAGLTGGEGN